MGNNEEIKPVKRVTRKKSCELVGDIIGLVEYGKIKVLGDIDVIGNNNIVTSESTADPLNVLIIEGNMKIRGSNIVVSGVVECQGKITDYGKSNTINIH